MKEKRIVDCRGLTCPQPVVQTKEALEKVSAGALQVIVDNEASCINVRRFAESQGHPVQMEKKGGDYYLVIKKRNESNLLDSLNEASLEAKERGLVIYIASEGVGRGDDELGRILMVAYLDTLSQLAREISHLIFMNSGVKLAVEGSPVLEQIENLKSMGVQVLSCGTCLNFFGVIEKLRVGTVSNMMSILEILSKAKKVLSP